MKRVNHDNENRDLILEVTEGLKYGSEAILALLTDDNDNYAYIEALRMNDITGKRLRKLYTYCCDKDVECLKGTIALFFLSREIRDRDILKNLDSDRPVPFIGSKYRNRDYETLDMDEVTKDFYRRYDKKNITR